MQTQTERAAKASRLKVTYPSGTVRLVRAPRMLIPAMVRGLLSGGWAHMLYSYEGELVDADATLAETAVNVLVLAGGVRVIF